jgi:uncharacterized protein
MVGTGERYAKSEEKAFVLTALNLYLYHCTIMFDRLPDSFDPLEFVEKKRRIKGSVPLAGMDRVRDALLSQEGDAKVDLRFGREGRIAAIAGEVDAELVLQCQCCMEALLWPVHSEVRLGVVGSVDEADRLPEEYEPILVESGGRVALVDIVQDELLLAIPSIPQHSECGSVKPKETSNRAEHPFAVLAQLRKNQS